MTNETKKLKGFQAITANLTAMLASLYILEPASRDYRMPFKAAFMCWFRSTRYQLRKKYLTPPRAKRVQWFLYNAFNRNVTTRTYRAVRILNLWVFFSGRFSATFDVPDWFHRLLWLQRIEDALPDAEEFLEERRWAYPSSYMGETFQDYFVIAGKHRDSGTLERSNFFCIARDLETVGMDVETRPACVIATATHWAVGWISTIMIHESASNEIKVRAYWILTALADYPVVDDDHLSQLEYDETYDVWEGMSLDERISVCRESNVSIFAARHDQMEYEEVFNHILYYWVNQG